MDVNFPINLSNASTTNFEDNLNGSLLGNLTICDECCQYTEEYDKNQTGSTYISVKLRPFSILPVFRRTGAQQHKLHCVPKSTSFQQNL